MTTFHCVRLHVPSVQVPEFQPIPIGVGPGETPFSQLAVSTSDTVRMSYIMNKLVRKGKFMMLVGTAGTGKTSIVKEYLRRYDHATTNNRCKQEATKAESCSALTWYLHVLHSEIHASSTSVVCVIQPP